MAKRAWTRRGAIGGALALSASACGRTPDAPPYAGEVAFNHGVASGDPGVDRIVLWTRVTPSQTGPVPVRWVLARDRRLTNVVQTGIFETTDARDYTVKVECRGLRSGAPYFYGFLAGEARSLVGQTRTLPTGRVEALTLAVVAGASHPHGFFNAYDALSERDDIDLVVCLGDYIFTGGLTGFGGETGMSLGRLPRPEIECVSLIDYRQRHAQYKAEAELQRAHALCPWIVAWDDQETASRAWMGGAGAMTGAAWSMRRRAAMQAYYEWMPIRDPDAGRPFESVFRNFQFGDLLTLFMLETRLFGRTAPFDTARDMPLYQTPWDFSNPGRPRAVSPAERYPPNVRLLPVPYEEIGGRLAPIWDWTRVSQLIQDPHNPPPGIRFAPDRTRVRTLLEDARRSLLGTAQESWLVSELGTSHRFGVTWQVLANQGLMAPLRPPNLSQLSVETLQALDRVAPGAARGAHWTRFGLPLSFDGWDGYPGARARLMRTLRAVGGNAIVLSGDAGGAFANDLPAPDNTRIGAEFAAPNVTAPTWGEVLSRAMPDFARLVQAQNPSLRWTDATRRGFLIVQFTHENVEAEFVSVSTVATSDYETETMSRFSVAPDDAPGVGAILATATQ